MSVTPLWCWGKANPSPHAPRSTEAGTDGSYRRARRHCPGRGRCSLGTPLCLCGSADGCSRRRSSVTGHVKGGLPPSPLPMLLQYLYVCVHSPKLGEESHLRHAGPGRTRCHSLLVSLHPSNICVRAAASAGNTPQLAVRAEP